MCRVCVSRKLRNKKKNLLLWRKGRKSVVVFRRPARRTQSPSLETVFLFTTLRNKRTYWKDAGGRGRCLIVPQTDWAVSTSPLCCHLSSRWQMTKQPRLRIRETSLEEHLHLGPNSSDPAVHQHHLLPVSSPVQSFQHLSLNGAPYCSIACPVSRSLPFCLFFFYECFICLLWVTECPVFVGESVK